MGTSICGKVKKTRWARYSKSKPNPVRDILWKLKIPSKIKKLDGRRCAALFRVWVFWQTDISRFHRPALSANKDRR
jgi:hypothetical protein